MRTNIVINEQIIKLLMLPKEYLGVQAEIILPSPKKTHKRKLVFDTIKIDTKKFKFNRDEANER